MKFGSGPLRTKHHLRRTKAHPSSAETSVAIQKSRASCPLEFPGEGPIRETTPRYRNAVQFFDPRARSEKLTGSPFPKERRAQVGTQPTADLRPAPRPRASATTCVRLTPPPSGMRRTE